MKVYVVVCEGFDKDIDVRSDSCGAFESIEDAVKHAREVAVLHREEGVPVYSCTVHEAEMDPYLFDAMSSGFAWTGGLDERCVWRAAPSNIFNRMEADEQALWEEMKEE